MAVWMQAKVRVSRTESCMQFKAVYGRKDENHQRLDVIEIEVMSWCQC